MEVVLWSVFVVVLIVALALASTIDWDAIVEYFAAPDERGEFAEHDECYDYHCKCERDRCSRPKKMENADEWVK